MAKSNRDETEPSSCDEELMTTPLYTSLYYVQSPSASNPPDSGLPSPYRPEIPSNSCASRATLSRYSSSRGSNNSFVHEKRASYGFRKMEEEAEEGEGEGEEEEEDRGWLWWILGFRKRRASTPSFCIFLQVFWRILLSFGVAVMVFCLATRPPTPKLHVKQVVVTEFRMSEGVDNSGVPTKILSYNCSLDLEMENNSKFFGIHLRPSIIHVTFENLDLAHTSGRRLYVPRDSSLSFREYVWTKDRTMYGAGRTMQDMLDSHTGLPLLMRLRLRSSVRVLWKVVKPRFTHHAQCRVVLKGNRNQRTHTLPQNSTCTTNNF